MIGWDVGGGSRGRRDGVLVGRRTAWGERVHGLGVGAPAGGRKLGRTAIGWILPPVSTPAGANVVVVVVGAMAGGPPGTRVNGEADVGAAAAAPVLAVVAVRCVSTNANARATAVRSKRIPPPNNARTHCLGCCPNGGGGGGGGGDDDGEGGGRSTEGGFGGASGATAHPPRWGRPLGGPAADPAAEVGGTDWSGKRTPYKTVPSAASCAVVVVVVVSVAAVLRGGDNGNVGAVSLVGVPATDAAVSKPLEDASWESLL